MKPMRRERELEEVLNLCFLVAKKYNESGCIAMQMQHGKHLSEFKADLLKTVGYDRIQLITISRPSAYGEYEPYRFVDTEAEFKLLVEKM